MEKKLIYVLIALITIVYVHYTIKINASFDLIQTSINDIKPQMLFEKLPIIINEPIVNPNQLTYTIFKYMHLYKRFKKLTKSHRCKSKYTVIFSPNCNQNVKVQHPFYNETVELPLGQHQCIIMPARWIIQIENNKIIESIELDDLFSLICRLFNLL